ncbi:MAG: FtsX-like permease family protein [Proteobacteria bacterium]|nr:FtsX-like permease family protein [Pseudomonadota bacterium]
MIWLKFAIREVRNNSRFSWFFIVNLTLGLVGFIALDSFNISIRNHIADRSRAMLSADLDITSSHLLTAPQLSFIEEALGPYAAKTRQIEFLSMVSGGNRSRLVQIVAVDRGFPLYGRILLDNEIAATPSLLNEQLVGGENVWIQPELLLTLDLKIGDRLRVGNLNFKISDVVREATGGSFWSAGIAYKVFMGLNQAEKTGLIRFGSRRRHHYLYRLHDNADVDTVAARLKTEIHRKYSPNPGIFVRTHRDASRQMKRTLGYLNDYLGLVSLVALFLAGVGTAYLFRSYLAGRMKEIAILMSLGATREETYLIQFLQIILLGTVSAALASFLAIFFLPLLTGLLQTFLPEGFKSYLSWRSIILAMAMGMLGSILFCLPVLVRIRHLKPGILFRENQLPGTLSGGFSWTASFSYLPVVSV